MFTSDKKSFLDRFVEAVPGLISWTALTSPIWLGLIAPGLVALFLTFLSIYWIYLALVHNIGCFIGYRKYLSEIATDWNKKCEELDFSVLPEKTTLPKDLNSVKHFILIPAVNEPFRVLDQTFASLAHQSYRLKENLYVAISCEERGAKEVEASINQIREKYKNELPNIWFYVHPKGIPGELVGGGAPNRSWGAKRALEEFTKRGINFRDVIFTTFDADTEIHKEFIARLTYAYLTCEKRDNHFYSTAVFFFDNNIWDVHTLMRIEANCITLGTLSFWTLNDDTQETFSCYSTSLQTLLDADFWDVSLIDDSVFFWRAFFARNGDFKAKVFYTPNSSDAVHAESYVKAHESLYKQLLRWGWGSVTTPIALKGFITHKNISAWTKAKWTYNKIERHLIFRTIVFLMTFGFAMLTLVNENVRQTTIAYQLPNIMSGLLTLGLIFLIPSAFFRLKLSAPMPKSWGILRRTLVLLETPLIMINLLTFSFIPFLEAETKMMLGKRYKSLHFTPKYR